MKNSVKELLMRVRREARAKSTAVVVKSMGRERIFYAYDWGSDTFIFEKDVWKNPGNHEPMLLVRKCDLVRGGTGYVMAISTGNHSVAAVPLLSGLFWNLGRIPAKQRSKLLASSVLCANVVEGAIHVSQRDVATDLIVAADEWLQCLGFRLDEIVMVERNPTTLDYYRLQGQEWRVKPLAWTRKEIELAIRASRNRINSELRYYHSVKGVHFLAYPDFHVLTQLIRIDYAKFVECMRELVSILDGGKTSLMRMEKINGHHEVEPFGIRRGEAIKHLVPSLEMLMSQIALDRLTVDQVAEEIEAIDAKFKSLLEHPELADETSQHFIETLYLHVSGQTYMSETTTVVPAFDDQRTPLPGATFRGGRPEFHPGVDERTRILLTNIEKEMSQEEVIEYANVYELRSHEEVPLGLGITREVVFKTNRRPLCLSFIEKKLKITKPGYGSYLLARVNAFKALGVGLGEYRLLMRLENNQGKEVNHFLRNRCPGETLAAIPRRLFNRVNDLGEQLSGEDVNVILALASLLGNAAAQNLIMKKYLPESKCCRYGEGKEIFEFGYDIEWRREMPVRVSLCSIRGALGWPNIAYSEENLEDIFAFYFERYSNCLIDFWHDHQETVNIHSLAHRFFDGFEVKTREMQWSYASRREQFDSFDPHVRSDFDFVRKWQFALWALERQMRRLELLRERFVQLVSAKAILRVQNQDVFLGANV